MEKQNGNNNNEDMDFTKTEDFKSLLIKNVFTGFTNEVGGSPTEFANILYKRFVVEDFFMHDVECYEKIENYFINVVRHKIAVYKAGMSILKISDFNLTGEEIKDFERNLWEHDISKFSAQESYGYTFYDFKSGEGKELFDYAWHHHKMNNPHHPEYWLNPDKEGLIKPLTVPKIYILEMISDWIGAGKTYNSSFEDWLPLNLHRFRFKNAGDVCNILNIVLKNLFKHTMHNNDVYVNRLDPEKLYITSCKST